MAQGKELMINKELENIIINRTGALTNHNMFRFYLDPFKYTAESGGLELVILFMTKCNKDAWNDRIITCEDKKHDISITSKKGVEETKALFIDLAFPIYEERVCHSISAIANKIKFSFLVL